MKTILESGKLDKQVEWASECLVEATVSMISSVCATQPRLEPEISGVPGNKVIAAVSLMGDIEIIIFLVMPCATAAFLTKQFAGFEIDFDSPDMADAVGELGNMVAGDLKARLDRRGVAVKISIPTVVRGQDLVVTIPTCDLVRQHHFSTDNGDFIVGLSAKRK